MDTKQKFNTIKASAIVGINVDNLNKALPTMKTIKPQKEKTSGKGRPTNVFSLSDIIKFRTYRKLFKSGYTNKAAAKMIESIDEAAIFELFQYSRQKKYAVRSEIVSALYHLAGEIEEKAHMLDIFKKIEELEPPKLSLNFIIFGDGKQKIVKFAAGVETIGFSPKGFKHLISTYDLRTSSADCHFIINFNNIFGDVLYWIRRLYSPSFNEWLSELETQLEMDLTALKK